MLFTFGGLPWRNGSSTPKTLEAIENHDCGFYYERSTNNFSEIPGSPVAYWVSAQVRNAFANNPLIEDVLETRNGMSTTNNNLFLKMWFEPCIEKCGFGSFTATSAKESSKKWFRYNKGGEFRRWYGNNDYVVNWENDGEKLKNMCLKGMVVIVKRLEAKIGIFMSQ